MSGESEVEELPVTRRYSDSPSADLEDVALKVKMWNIEELLKLIGTHRKQVALFMMGAFAYGSFMQQNFLPTLSTAAMWELWPELEERKTTYNWVFAASAIARLLGSLTLIPSLDIYGRRTLIFGCLILETLGTLLSALSWNFGVYIFARVLTAFSVSALPSATVIYVLEVATTKRRALPPTIMQIFHVLAIIYVTAVNIGLTESESVKFVRSWRYLYLCGLMPCLVPLVIMCFTWIETPRFYIVKGEETRAWRSLGKLTSGGLEGLEQQLGWKTDGYIHRLEGLPVNDVPDKQWNKEVLSNFVRMLKVAKAPAYRYNTIMLTLVWGLKAFAYWGATTYMTTFFKYAGLASNTTTLSVFAVQLPGMVLTYLQMQWDHPYFGGRINSLRLCTLVCAIGLFCMATTLYTNPDRTGLVFTFSIVTYFLAGPTWNAIYLYSSEIYPTSHRGAALALFSTVNAISTLVTTFVGSIAIDDSNVGRYPLIWGSVYLAAFFVCLLLRHETRATLLIDHIG